MNGTRPPQVQQVTCRHCGKNHHNPIFCPDCKRATPHIAVMKGGAK